MLRWNVASGTPTVLGSVDGGITALAVSRTGRDAITGGEAGQLLRWDLHRDTSRPVPRGAGRPRINGVAFTSDDEALVIDAQGELSRVSVTEGRVVGAPVQNGSSLRSLAVSQDGRFAATGDDGQRVRLWDVKTLEALDVEDLPTDALSLSFCTEAGALRLWVGTQEGAVLALDVNPR